MLRALHLYRPRVSATSFAPPVYTVCLVRWRSELSRELLDQKRDDHIRSHFPSLPTDVVEEVVKARNGIWGDQLGRQSHHSGLILA